MFKKGNFILYETIGVCQVNEISRTDFSDNNQLYYYLVPRFEKNMTIYIPVDSDKVTMRAILSRQEAESFVLSWPGVKCKKYSNDRERAQVYKQVIKSGNCLELASMIKEIAQIEQSCKGRGKMLPLREKDGIKTARKLLFGELATALDIGPEEVPDYILSQTGCFC
ncbi:CarD family transcriptional regulator [Clostridium sp. AM58-1XD]|uniref:CarD family transcriptional regulator n=1 Tax=Clostridium sp. AM58-1XD TaxID=2292307 RepID=UPI000E4F4CCF|nr:CarD family transcriptional regulator [Clostridium sp. AM58-1XD]RGY99850.1 hypothetical protein DXA13_06450 [Clostridium sp. AM58-1XD]